MILLIDLLKEVGEGTSQTYKWEELSSNEWDTNVSFTTDSETDYQVNLEYFESNFPFAKDLPGFALEFLAKLKGEDEFSNTVVTNKGEVYKVMATIANIVQHYLKDNKIITYSPEKSLVKRLVSREIIYTKHLSLRSFLMQSLSNMEK
jgi:hypothetical protein